MNENEALAMVYKFAKQFEWVGVIRHSDGFAVFENVQSCTTQDGQWGLP
jgi:hypothetical protein